jgi:hypothetical protein
MNSNSNKEYCFVSIKGFGDLTILLSMLRRVPNLFHQNCSILLGSHLKELFDALGSNLQLRLLDIGSKGGAPIFALRTKGALAGMRSAIYLRASLSSTVQNVPLTLIFQKLSWRERFISGEVPAVSLPLGQDNVYSAYEIFLKTMISLLPEEPPRMGAGNVIGIFPTTSSMRKNMTSAVINQIATQCKSNGFDPVVFLLGSESIDGSISIPIRRIDRNFPALIGAIKSTSMTICADSLPAHLSFYFKKYVYVVAPRANPYWLPISSYANGYCSTFDDFDGLNKSLERFFSIQ